MKRFGDRLDGFLPKAEKGGPARQMANVRLVRDREHGRPCLLLPWCPGRGGAVLRQLNGARPFQRNIEPAEDVELEQIRRHDEKARAEHPVNGVAFLPKPYAAEGNKRKRRQGEADRRDPEPELEVTVCGLRHAGAPRAFRSRKASESAAE